ncbi:hypothetical protein [Romboutsia sp.]|uniref:hypothetical protein n=1 Tax=Romboutsia sp. TaxID=1965302 RepID=UPI002B95ED74|nr:hypothetical protein [Romboutsia sp.]HSQ89180.1 hypothetical protein [Romboutsia sp.]
MNTIEALEKIREGYSVYNKIYCDYYRIDYIAWSLDYGCICGFKNNSKSEFPQTVGICVVLDNLYEDEWIIVEDKK